MTSEKMNPVSEDEAKDTDIMKNVVYREDVVVCQQAVENVRKQRFAFTIERDIFLLQTMLSLNPWQFGHQRWAEAVRVFSRRTWEVTQRTLQSRLKVLREQFKKQSLTSKTGTEEQKSRRESLLTDIEATIDAANDGHHILGYSPPILSDLPPVEVELEESHSTCGTPVGGSNKHASYAYHVDRQDWEEADRPHDQSASECTPELCRMRAKRRRLLEEGFYIKQAEHEMEMNSRRQALEEAREKRLLEEGQRRDKLAATQMEIQKQHIQVIFQQQQQQTLLVQLISQLSSKRNPNQDH